MLGALSRKIFGTENDRDLKRLQPLVVRINELESSYQKLSDAEIRGQTPLFKERLSKGATLEEILPEVFACVREVSKRVLNMRHFDVQLIGGVILHEGKIAEMKTGEGKTLVATLPVYLNSLTGNGVHVITVNDYLAKRDAAWMGQVYRFLGLEVGVIVHGLDDRERAEAYRHDVTYGTNNEFGFDYLRDNMKYDLADYVQRDLNFAIVDEVDSILIDEARTPLIISGPSEESTEKYYRINRIIPPLQKEKHYTIDEKAKSAVLTEEGVAKVESQLAIKNLYDPVNIETLHHVNQALKAHTLFRRDVDYVVKEDKVIIVDEFTGRLMPGRRWSDGLHQAVEAKERVKIENENQTLATITFQNYFRMYNKLSGMTGTADTEATEFSKIYNLSVRVIPTHMPMIRRDDADVIYKSEKEKFNAVLKEVKELYQKGTPILIGTISIEKSEELSSLLERQGINHHVLNAKHHEREAEIVAQAGRLKAVTISTNMAGRGTDIVLGGNPQFLARSKADPEMDPEKFARALAECQKICEDEKKKVIAAGGLRILGTERHESRRIDNQLRGRSGRQGDPGSSRFYLSLEDDLLRIFGSERIATMMDRLGIQEDEPITHRWISKAIENAQKKVEGHNFDIRKNLLEFDDVMNEQRKTIYDIRRSILGGEKIRDLMMDYIDYVTTDMIDTLGPSKKGDRDWDPAPLRESVYKQFGIKVGDLSALVDDVEKIGTSIYEQAIAHYEEKEKQYSSKVFGHVQKLILLSVLDHLWKDHLLAMDHLREGIGLRGYAQKDPLVEYKREGFGIFQHMITQFQTDVVEKIFWVQIAEEKEAAQLSLQRERQAMQMGRGSVAAPQAVHVPGRVPAGVPMGTIPQGPPLVSGSAGHRVPKIGRNDPCSCGSGKKYKKCCGNTAQL